MPMPLQFKKAEKKARIAASDPTGRVAELVRFLGNIAHKPRKQPNTLFQSA
jgi:hypothetical protein